MKKAKLNPNLKEQKQINNELRFEKKIDLKKKKLDLRIGLGYGASSWVRDGVRRPPDQIHLIL